MAILKNLLDAVEETSPSLRHVTFYQGGKAYGADLGPFKTPAREDDLRLMPPNFYYDQEDFLRQRQPGKAAQCSAAARPLTPWTPAIKTTFLTDIFFLSCSFVKSAHKCI